MFYCPENDRSLLTSYARVHNVQGKAIPVPSCGLSVLTPRCIMVTG